MTNRLRRRTQSHPSHPSLYAFDMSHNGKRKFASAQDLTGIDEETALLRLYLRRVLATQPDNTSLIFKVVGLIIRAVSAQTRISRNSPESDFQGIEDILRDASEKLGLQRIPWDSSC